MTGVPTSCRFLDPCPTSARLFFFPPQVVFEVWCLDLCDLEVLDHSGPDVDGVAVVQMLKREGGREKVVAVRGGGSLRVRGG